MKSYPSSILAHPRLRWDGWAISRPLARALWARLDDRRPRRILELGSGTSTAVLAAWAARSGARVTTLEHDRRYLEATRSLLEAVGTDLDLGLSELVDLRLAPCRPRPAQGAGRIVTYHAALEGPFDFAFVDGPPLAVGRRGAFFLARPHLAEDWELWLKDGRRAHERECVSLWTGTYDLVARLADHDPRGVWVLGPADRRKGGRADGPAGTGEGAVDAAGGDRGESVAAPGAPRAAGPTQLEPPHLEPAPTETERPEPATDSAEAPLVSCIMPTRDRRPFVPRAIRYFRRQDYPNRELIIVDDGTDPVDDLVPDDPAIRYVRLEGRHSIGAKRNAACRIAGGDLIAHWDDDDWSAPWRLSYQVGELLASGADICGLDRLLFFDPGRGEAWEYRYGRGRAWIAGGTLCYRRAVWRARPFPDISNGEDTRFVWSAGRFRIRPLARRAFYAALVHGGNTSPKQTGSPRWHRRSIAEVRELLGDDWAHYAGPENEPPAERASTAPAHRALNRDGPAASDRAPWVTVSLPYHGCRPYLRQAVESVLVQSHARVRVVVVNDGDPDPPWDLLDDLDDPRLVRFDLPRSYGRYFADAVVLRASGDGFFAIQDADDWSHPERLAALLRPVVDGGAVAAFSACTRTGSGGRDRVERFPGVGGPPPPTLRHRAHHVGLYRRDALLSIGGPFGGFRFGYDTLLVNLVAMAGPVAYVDRPLYTYRVRQGSLATSAATGLRSRRRAQVTSTLRGLYAEALAAHGLRRANGLDERGFNDRLRALAARHRPARESRSLDREVARLRAVLVGRTARLRPDLAAEV